MDELRNYKSPLLVSTSLMVCDIPNMWYLNENLSIATLLGIYICLYGFK